MNEETTFKAVEPTEACPVTSTEIVDPNSARSIYEEALAESLTSDRDTAKSVISQRIKEIQRLEVLLAKAKADLKNLLAKDVTEIAMTATPNNMLLGDPVRKGRISAIY
jgi:signal transduction histidine kinase